MTTSATGQAVAPMVVNAYDVSGTATPVTSTSPLPSTALGSVAHDGVDADSPVKIGGYAKTTAPTAVQAGDRVNAWFGLNGQQATMNVDASGNAISNANGIMVTPGLSSTYWCAQTVITNSGADTVIKAAPGAGVYLYVTSITLNSTALGGATSLLIRDGSGQQYLTFEIPAAGWLTPVLLTFPVPIKLLVNQSLNLIMSAAVTGNMRMSAQGFTSTT